MDSAHGHVVGSALWLPLFEELSGPMAVARLAAEAEEAGWDGVFVWDHLRWQAPVREVADPWMTLAATASATERLRFGPMVTPLPRRRPAKVARETATLDRLSNGRLVMGVGIGGDRFGGELSKTGEQLDDRVRGQMLDESLAGFAGNPKPLAFPLGLDPRPYIEVGATWWLPEFAPEDVTLDQVRGVLREGPLTR